MKIKMVMHGPRIDLSSWYFSSLDEVDEVISEKINDVMTDIVKKVVSETLRRLYT